MRTLLYAAIKELHSTDDRITKDGVTRVYQHGALGSGDIPAQPNKPFIVIREMPTIAQRLVFETTKCEHALYQVYCYDVRGSYRRIDDILRSERATIEGLVGQQSTTGLWCIGATWEGLSQDFMDEQYDAVVRYASVHLMQST